MHDELGRPVSNSITNRPQLLGQAQVQTLILIQVKNNRQLQLKTDYNKKKQTATMFLSKIFEDILVNQFIYVRNYIAK